MPYTLFIGGARSGKSSLAVARARAWSSPSGASGEQPRPVAFVVTGVAGDDEMRDRIARHQRERDATWTTVEAPMDLLSGVKAALASGPDTLMVLDCLSFWVANRLMAVETAMASWSDAEDQLADELRTVTQLLRDHPVSSVVVTNEVGSGLVPDSALGRQFRDTLGRANTLVSLNAERAYLVVAGRTLELAAP